MMQRGQMLGGIFVLAIAFLAALPFVEHAASRGLFGLLSDIDRIGVLYRGKGLAANLSLFVHMILGALITTLAFVQVCAPIRTFAPSLHRWSGRVMLSASALTAIGGLTYIALVGTVGGPLMSFGFALYGVLMGIAAVQTLRLARARHFTRHRQWGLRLAVLAIGSWIYRVHYELWTAMTGGWGMDYGFTGPFDQVQVFAFYLPYLLALEIWFRIPRRIQKREFL